MFNSRNFSRLAIVVIGASTIVACSGSDDASNADPCDAAQKVTAAFAEGESAESADEAFASYSSLADALGDFAKAAPDDLQADSELLASGLRLLAESDPEAGPSEATLEVVNDESFDRAGDRLEDYFEATCGLEFG